MSKLDQTKTPFYDKLKSYAESNSTSFDVPGHKLGNIDNSFKTYVGSNVFLLDSNSPKGLDNLSKPTGVIKDAHDLAADAFGAKNAYFLINGTSQGIVTMIMTACRANEKIIMPRNCHKSAINGLILSGAIPIFMKPLMDNELGIANGIDLKELEETIKEHPDSKAIFVVNPTYFGATSNLKEIVRLAHLNNMAVLVDEAHGAHFTFNRKLPISAIKAGADMVSVSIHKSLGSLTQSSLLLSQGKIISQNRVQSTLNILNSTSPSSLLMASLDTTRSLMATSGSDLINHAIELSNDARKEINKIKGLKAIDKSYMVNNGAFDFDETKIVIKVSDLGITGFDAYNILSRDSNIQMELAETHLVLALISVGSKKSDIDKLIEGLKNLTKYKTDKIIEPKIRFTYPDIYERPREAYHAPKHLVKLKDALNEVAAESIMVYPPGIPIVIPGEIISKEILQDIKFYISQGSTLLSDTEDGFIKVIDKLNWKKYEGDL